MKTLVFTAAIFVVLNVSAFGQATKPAAVAGPSAKRQAEVLTREKFDPTRDPSPDLQKGIETATKSGKRIILDVGGEWCGWCVCMDKFFFENPGLAKIREDNFVWVKVNYSEENENKPFLAPFPEPQAFPHLYILDAKGKLLHSHNTADLEMGKGYNLVKFTRFLKAWSPKKLN